MTWRALAIGLALATLTASCSSGDGESSNASNRGGGSEEVEVTTTEADGTATDGTEPEAEETEEVRPPAVIASGGTFSSTRVAYFESADDVEATWMSDDDLMVSPDQKLGARFIEQTAVDDARWEFVDLTSGDVVDQIEISETTTTAATWTPDSRAFSFRVGSNIHLVRLGGTSSIQQAGNSGGIDISSDATRTAALQCDNYWSVMWRTVDVTEDADPSDSGEVSEEGCRAVQATDSDGNPVTLLSKSGSILRMGADGEFSDLELVGFPEGSYITHGRGCGPIAALSVTYPDPDSTMHGSNFSGLGIYDAIEDRAHFLPDVSSSYCPIPSPDGRKAALEITEDGIDTTIVFDLDTGDEFKIANGGAPLAWSADSTEVLVRNNGHFIVSADGSGDTSVQILEDATFRRWCRLGDTGKLLIQTSDALTLYDVGEQTAVEFEYTNVGDGCQVDDSGRWGLWGNLLIDLERDTSSVLAERTNEDGALFNTLGEYRFFGVTRVNSAGNASLYTTSD